MQKSEFNTGGFVLHGITGLIHNAKISAWYDQRGELLDAEMITPKSVKTLPRTYIDAESKLRQLGYIHK